MKTFLLGVGMGVGAVLAPAIGLGLPYVSLEEDTRKELANKANDFARAAREIYEGKVRRFVSLTDAVSTAAANGFGGAGD